MTAMLFPQMYGPPSDCKGKVEGEEKSASMYPAFVGG
jgi:hypothetical protein